MDNLVKYPWKWCFEALSILLLLWCGSEARWGRGCSWLQVLFCFSGTSLSSSLLWPFKTVKCFSPQNHLSSPRTVEFVFDLRLLWRFTQVLWRYKTQTLSCRPTSVTLCFSCELLAGSEWRRSVFGFRPLLMFKAWSPHISLTWSLAVLCRVRSEGALSTVKPGFGGYFAALIVSGRC